MGGIGGDPGFTYIVGAIFPSSPAFDNFGLSLSLGLGHESYFVILEDGFSLRDEGYPSSDGTLGVDILRRFEIDDKQEFFVGLGFHSITYCKNVLKDVTLRQSFFFFFERQKTLSSACRERDLREETVNSATLGYMYKVGKVKDQKIFLGAHLHTLHGLGVIVGSRF